jgi:GGDEF domain-containing protein
VTISIGLALSSEFAQSTLEEIMHQADMALYAAKRRAAIACGWRSLPVGATPLRNSRRNRRF